MTITASANGDSWTELKRITSGLPSEYATDVNIGPCDIPSGMKYIRFMVNAATPNDPKAGHSHFVISELRLNRATNVATAATPDESLYFVEEDMLIDLYNQLQAAKTVLANNDATNEQRIAATNALTEIYDIVIAATKRNADRLSDLITATRQLAAELGNNTENLTQLSTSASQYSSNAQYTGENESDRLTTWEVLFDGRPNTFFHSTYAANTTDGKNHYVQIDMVTPTTAESTDLMLTYTTRNSSSYTYAPADVTIQYSPDGTTWTVAQQLSELLPYTHNTKFESETFSVPAGTRYVRFMVNRNRTSAANPARTSSNGHDYFAISELVLYSYSVDAVPNTATYPKANSEVLTAALRQARNASTVLDANRATHLSYNNAYDTLLPHYQTLLAIKSNPGSSTSIDQINADSENGELEIYTLGGVRLRTITTPGIYIINGRKVTVR